MLNAKPQLYCDFTAMDKNGKLQLLALTVEELAEVLRLSGARHSSEENILKDISDGAPTNPDGTINYVHYLAWLATQNQ